MPSPDSVEASPGTGGGKGKVHLEREDHIATITIDSPATKNALTVDMARRVVAICQEVDDDLDIGAVIVRGAGGTFCSGADRSLLDWIGESPADDDRYEALGEIYRAFLRVGELAPPTVAAVQGAAVGAGINLLLATDLRIVARDATLVSGFVRIGLHPGGGHFSKLARTIGPEAAAAFGLFGAGLKGEDAVRVGLAWEAVEAADVDDRARTLVADVARDPRLARRVTASMRTEIVNTDVNWQLATDIERGPQLWSLEGRHRKDAKDDHGSNG